MEDWVNLVVSVLSGLAICIPLAMQLVKFVRQFVQEKNWNKIIEMVTEYMITAEGLYANGNEKKAWVLEMLKTSAKVSNFDLTEKNLLKISELIDQMCVLSKKINVNTEIQTEE